MDNYREILISTILLILKIYGTILAILGAILLILLIFKKYEKAQKFIKLTIVSLICTIIICVIQIFPRLFDLSQNSFVKINNSELIITDTNSVAWSGSVSFGGYSYAVPKNKNEKSVFLIGITYTDISLVKGQTGDIIYAKHSHQIITIE